MTDVLFDSAQLIACSNGALFGPGSPPLPAPPLLAFDEVTEIDPSGGRYGQGLVRANKELSSLSWVFENHFPQDPVLPGTMMVDGLLQLTGFFAAFMGYQGRGRAAKIGAVEFLAEVSPDEPELSYRIDVKRRHSSRGIIVADGAVLLGPRTCVSASSLWVIIKE